MCGIAGVAGDFNPIAARACVERMMHALERRGPDGSGMHEWPGAIFGHRRLAIFDLSDAGAQPMTLADERVGVTFNGAVFNFRELRAELQQAGFVFRSNTDTEVLLHGYRAWGIERLVARLRGMFAFGLWDAETRTLYLVRDRLGVKPLLYVQDGNQIAFASTAHALHAAGYADEIDESAVAQFLEYGFIPDAYCIYRGVKKLPAANILRWRAGNATLEPYWEAPVPRESQRIPFEDAVQRTQELLLDAVRLRLQADVRVGALLSGGIDSSLVCWAIGKLGGNVTAYTVATPGDAWDEAADAAATARELGISHRILTIEASQAPSMRDLVNAYGEPFACASALGMMTVSQTVKEEATVLLTGDGGDDVFLGYPRHLHYAGAQRAAALAPPFATGAWRRIRGVVPKRGALRRMMHFADYAFGGLGAVLQAHDGLPAYAEMGMLGERFENVTIADREIAWSVARGRRVLDDFIAYERGTRFTGEYLTKVDGATMYHGLEARSPFLDQELWTFAGALPYDVRLHRNSLKAILRELARRTIGERVARGAKRGFGVPVQRWISGKWRGNVAETFRYSLLDREGWIRADAVQRALASLRAGETAPVQLWHAYVLETWMKERAFSADVRAVSA